ncbi:MAG: ParB/RepB/Spo0J family partition protein, partial [Bacilli bacterium]|nr:ParB/RepB/Spo0J family partition protein [Bacilli bacterium]
GLTTIPAIIRTYNDTESARIALIDNLQRKDLSPIEEARAYKRLLEMEKMTQDELAVILGKSQSAVANKIRLLNLPIEIQEALLNNKISERHARSLLTVKDTRLQIELLNKIIEKKMTVRELDSEIKNMSNMFIPEEFNNNESTSFASNDQGSDNKFIPPMAESTNQFIPSMTENNNQFIPPMNNESTMPTENKFINDFPKPEENPTNQFINQPLPANKEELDNNNPLFTSSLYEAPREDNPSANGDIYTNPFTAIRRNTEMQNRNNMLVDQEVMEENNSGDMYQNPDFNNIDKPADLNSAMDNLDVYQTPTEDNQETSNPLDMFKEPQEEPKEEPTPVDSGFDTYEASNNFNIDDYKLPGVDYDDLVSNMDENMDDVNALDNVTVSSDFDAGNKVYRYAEDNPNYMSVDKNYGVSSLDEVINVLKATIDRLKEGTIKIETEEIDFDDWYQIVIKVDKK